LCQIEPETRLFCLLIVGIHENLWYKMRRELIQTTHTHSPEARANRKVKPITRPPLMIFAGGQR
jgi:hypothetical protein